MSGSVDTLVPGTYTISYACVDDAGNESSATRKVTIQDTTKPVLTLNGSKTVTIAVGSQYVDAGATCTDNIDGKITPKMSGSVNSSARGTYTITYNCIDTAGNSAIPATRTVQFIISTVQPIVSVVGAATTEGNSLDFVISLSHPYEYPVDAYYVTVDGQAIAGSDYTFTSDFVRFEPGQIEHTVSVETTIDDSQEGDEKMYFELTFVTDAKISNEYIATGTISDS